MFSLEIRQPSFRYCSLLVAEATHDPDGFLSSRVPETLVTRLIHALSEHANHNHESFGHDTTKRGELTSPKKTKKKGFPQYRISISPSSDGHSSGVEASHDSTVVLVSPTPYGHNRRGTKPAAALVNYMCCWGAPSNWSKVERKV